MLGQCVLYEGEKMFLSDEANIIFGIPLFVDNVLLPY